MSYKLSIFLLIFLLSSCHPHPVAEDAAVWKKIQLDFRSLDAEGLRGPASGKVAVNYEFCVPKNDKYWAKVQKTDPTARKYESGKGRINCSDQHWLVVGSTNQKNYQRVLYELAALPYVNRIEEVFWE